MKINSVKNRAFLFLLVALTGGWCCLPAFGSVYDDVTAWWHFDYDANQNGLAELAEVRDQRDWGTAAEGGAGGYHATAVSGSLGSPSWTNEAVSAAGGNLYGRMSMQFNPVTNSTQCFPDAVGVTNLTLKGSATIVTRFRWDGYAVNETRMVWAYNNGFTYGDNIGWLFGVRENYSVNRLAMFVGQTTFYMTSAAVETGKWYEAAVVLTDNGPGDTDTVEMFLWPQDDTVHYQNKIASTVTNAADETKGTFIGVEGPTSDYAGANAEKAFKGAVNHIAVWDRALSYDEVMEAFCHPQPLLQVGVANAGVGDLRDLSERNSNDYLPHDPWHTMPQWVSAGNRDATVKIPLAQHQSLLDQAVHLKVRTDDGQNGRLALIVNSVTNETQTARNGADLHWCVTADQLVAGTNSFVLRYKGGPAEQIRFDHLAIGGSWQVGYADDSYAEFSNQLDVPDDFYVTVPDWLRCERAVGLTQSETNTFLHFFMSEELASRYLFSYSVKLISQSEEDALPFSIDLNGELLENHVPVANGTVVTVPIEQPLKAGKNVIAFRYDSGSSGWMCFDYHRLTMREKPKGTFIQLR
ncbi:MAG: hypothetical protein R6V06_03210 [Kiritimatiellia bacterium]